MAITRVQKIGSNTGTGVSSLAATAGTATTSGNFILVAVMCHATDRTVTVTDSGGNTYTSDKHKAAGGAGAGPFITVLSSKTTSAVSAGGTITASFSGGTVNNAVILAYEYSGLAASSRVDQTAGGSGSATNAATSGVFTTTQNDELLFGCIAWESASASVSTGWTKLDEFDNFLSASKSVLTQESIVLATGAYESSATLQGAPSGGYASVGVSYKAEPVAPASLVAPAVTGVPNVGQVLTCSTGTWDNFGAPAYTYQWQKDNSGGGSYSNISLATSSTYTLLIGDFGDQVRCVVTNTDAYGATSANSNAKTITNPAPVNTVAPVVSGTAHVGSSLSSTTGTWTNFGTPVYAYQWQRDNNGGLIYSSISGATSSSYTLKAIDNKCHVRCSVINTDIYGATAAPSNADAVLYAAPTNSVSPTISGTPAVGAVLTVTQGTWGF